MSQQEQVSNPLNSKPRMLFGNKLDQEIYGPWKQYYIDYTQLKRLLKENVILQDNWSEKDEQSFVKFLDQNLEKVYSFQHQKYDELNTQLNTLQHTIQTPDNKFDLNQFLSSLDEVLTLAQELDHFQRLNYTGFIKIVKKHDRLHPQFSVKPLLNVRLKDLPFHSEDYSPLLYKISALFQFLRENYDINQSLNKLSSFNDTDTSNYQSFKFWIHPDNLMEVKTTILRHLPVLIFNSNGIGGSDDDDDDEYDDDNDNNKHDPIINCLYFDNPHFDIYNSKLTKSPNSSTLRLKWLGNLAKHSKISMEKKNFDPSSENFNINEKLSIKPKNINSLINNRLNFLKKKETDEVEIFKKFGEFIYEQELQPVLRTVYKRTAFQIPGDDKIRITIDSNLLFIREDSFDKQRPIRDPTDWHRSDIDSNPNYEKYLRTGEFNRFPYSVMEIKIKRFSSNRKILWIEDLINSHLVKEIPNFSKFIHGISSLFLEDDHLDNIPFWYNELEQDIKIGPGQYFKQHSNSIKQENDDDNLNKFKSMVSNSNNLNLRKSFSGALLLDEPLQDGETPFRMLNKYAYDNDDSGDGSEVDESSEDLDDDLVPRDRINSIVNLDTSKNKLDIDSEDEEIELPPGVIKPESYIKNAGPLRIEPKVWLANERTFNRWLQVTTLLSSVTFIIYSSANKANDYDLSTYLAYVYFGLTLFSGIWGYYIFMRRREIIMERDGAHLDNMVGPLIVAGGLVFALIFNFVFGFKRVYSSPAALEFYNEYPTHHKIHQFIVETLF
ncbi:Phosphate metabolism transcription protein [Yamadazyma tenuis]|uniref:SPX-domain-containing protein n=1 Tax=Candida tenuis (strain ATCC 10573 / BCRC 21748 / CBS 615 / JCM 9827 / NBRC 10315 / NRRL Y-1498 / VKM Y-70) TaxID=590646 RepID=G3BEV1_CANTC|nr:SPX-domain-containing protein [Yamadazyma tenuis ATCC 10573]EGV60600.1 SPX-domain-containing protein [Yamadazyma tenuis ATCC 10573]WEJ94151.1 Phosphate metabolism transcription protein [Yamadazyma tenuis]